MKLTFPVSCLAGGARRGLAGATALRQPERDGSVAADTSISSGRAGRGRVRASLRRGALAWIRWARPPSTRVPRRTSWARPPFDAGPPPDVVAPPMDVVVAVDIPPAVDAGPVCNGPGQRLCGALCVDVRSDAANCGGCWEPLRGRAGAPRAAARRAVRARSPPAGRRRRRHPQRRGELRRVRGALRRGRGSAPRARACAPRGARSATAPRRRHPRRRRRTAARARVRCVAGRGVHRRGVPHDLRRRAHGLRDLVCEHRQRRDELRRVRQPAALGLVLRERALRVCPVRGSSSCGGACVDTGADPL